MKLRLGKWSLRIAATLAIATAGIYIYESYFRYGNAGNPSLVTFNNVLARDGISPSLLHLCQPWTNPLPGDDYVMPADNYFDISAVLYDPDDPALEQQRKNILNTYRALASAGLLKSERIEQEKNGVRRPAERFTLTALGWRQLAGRGCFHAGNYDNIRAVDFEWTGIAIVNRPYELFGHTFNLKAYETEYKVTIKLDATGPDSFETWARPAAVRERLHVLNFYATKGNVVPMHVRFSDGVWKSAGTQKPRVDNPSPPIPPEQVLTLVDDYGRKSDLQAKTCFALPKSWPTLGIVQTAAPDYQLTFSPVDGIDATRLEFVEKQRSNAALLEKAGILRSEKKNKDLIYTLSEPNREFQLPGASPCLALGKTSTEVIFSQTTYENAGSAYVTRYATHTRVTEVADWARQSDIGDDTPRVKKLLELGWGCRGRLRTTPSRSWSIQENKCFAPS